MSKIMKHLLCFALCVLLCVNICVPVFAANSLGISFNATLDKPVITVSDQDQTVVMNITPSSGITTCAIGYTVVCPDAITLSGVASGDEKVNITAADYNLTTKMVSWQEATVQDVSGITNLGVITFTIPANTPAGTYTLGVEKINLSTNFGQNLWEGSGTASTTLTVVDSNTNSYVASLNCTDTNLNVGEQLAVNVVVTGVGYANFASSEVVLTYDATKLSFNKSASTLNGATIPDQINGTIKLEDYGDPQALGTAYTLVFDAVSDGDANVTMTSAKFSTQENAASSDLVVATLSNASVDATLTQMYSVTLPDTVTGNTSVKKGDDYTFAVKDANNYTYEVTATMDGQNVRVKDNENGTYTIEDVTGVLAISVVATPKSYNVSFAGAGAGDVADKVTTATYGTPYTFTKPSADGYAYSVAITYTGTENTVEYSTNDTGVVTIAGDKITGDITITVDKTQTDANISVTGEGASDVTHPDRAIPGTDFTFTVTKNDRYNYVVTVKVNDSAVTPVEGENGRYTIAGSAFKKGDTIKINVTKTLKTDSVKVEKYVTVDQSQIWLITVNTTKMDGSTYTYNGEKMFWSEKYNEGNGAYVYLVVATEQPAVTAAELAIITGDATTVNYGMDVNMTGTVDSNDAQMTYNMYKPYYSNFTEDVTVEKFLRADVNFDGFIDVKDAQVIVNHLLG